MPITTNKWKKNSGFWKKIDRGINQFAQYLRKYVLYAGSPDNFFFFFFAKTFACLNQSIYDWMDISENKVQLTATTRWMKLYEGHCQ